MTSFGTQAQSTGMKMVAGLLFASGVVLVIDVGEELLIALRGPASVGAGMWLHVGFELFASVGVAVAFFEIVRRLRVTVSDLETETDRLRSLRDDFDAFVHRQFEDWDLSRAEQDVALLTVRGLCIAEIAAARNTREGTVKAQLSHIFGKVEVSNRAEFVARVLDEFLGVTSEELAARGQPATLVT